MFWFEVELANAFGGICPNGQFYLPAGKKGKMIEIF